MRGGSMMGMSVQVSNDLEVRPTIDSHKEAEEKQATEMKKFVFHDSAGFPDAVTVSLNRG